MLIDQNLYWDAGGREVTFDGMSFQEWKSLGHDPHSLIADPEFRDAGALDFRLKPDSPAFGIGFEPFDYGQAGLYGNQEWRTLACSGPAPPLSKAPEPPPIPIIDDFENQTPGRLPGRAQVRNEDHLQAVVVTDETAASGRQSLRIADSPEFRHEYNPHLYYEPQYGTGTARIGFELRVSANANLYVECRENGSSYLVGPRLSVSEGILTFAGTNIGLPADRWVRIEISTPLGPAAGSWEVTLTLPDGTVQRFPDLRIQDPEFTRLDWVGFVSNGRQDTVFFLDNLHISVTASE